jgi:hypothetical protein
MRIAWRLRPHRGLLIVLEVAAALITSVASVWAKGIIIMQTVTFMDSAGNVAQYAVYDANSRGEYHWSTDHGDSGSDISSAQAQITARMVLRASMAVRAKTDQATRYRSEEKRLRRPAGRPMLRTVKCEEAPRPRVPAREQIGFGTMEPRGIGASRSRPARDTPWVR